MSTQFAFGTIYETWPLPPGGIIASSANDPQTRSTMVHDVRRLDQEFPPNPGQNGKPRNNVDLPVPSTYHFAPFDTHFDTLVDPLRWQQDLEDHFTNAFKEFVLFVGSIDVMVARTLQIIDNPSPTKIHGLALAVCTHWMRMQFRCKNANVYAREIVTFISTITDHLGRLSIHARNDFVDELNHLCIKKLKVIWHWYVTVVIPGVSPVTRKDLFMRVMTVVAMICHLFHAGILRHGAVLNVVGYIAMMSPKLDVVAIIYACLHELGPRLVLEQAGRHFVQWLLGELSLFTVHRDHSDPLCRLVLAINTLIAEWHQRTRVTLYHTHAKGNN